MLKKILDIVYKEYYSIINLAGKEQTVLRLKYASNIKKKDKVYTKIRYFLRISKADP